jgi:hypothetical protein
MDLMATFWEKAIAYSTVTNYLPAALVITCNATPFSDATSLLIDDSDETILRTLQELLFSSIRQLAH